MSHRSLHFHDGERVLLSMRPSKVVLVPVVFSALLPGVVAGVVLAAGLFIADAALRWNLPWPAYFLPFLFCCGVVAFQRIRAWTHAMFCVTTDRIILQYPRKLLSPSRMHTQMHHKDGHSMHMQPSHDSTITIKWPVYQESVASHGNPLEMIAHARKITIRYGSADAEREVLYPSIPFAEDIKHYLDKVDSASRRHALDDIRPFVFKKYGQRDDASAESRPA